jgi:hypothetical protein
VRPGSRLIARRARKEMRLKTGVREKGWTRVGGSPGRASESEACARIKSARESTMGVGEVEDAL